MTRRHKISKILSLATLMMALPVSLAFGILGELATLAHHVKANNRHELSQMDYGYPIHWLSQDETEFTPPKDEYPVSFSFGRPQDVPTNLRPGMFVADVAILGTAPFVVFLGVAGGFALLARRPRYVATEATA